MHIKNIILIAILFVSSCVVPSEPPDGGARLTFCSPDTISPYAPIKIAFSSPVKDSQVIEFSFLPPFFGCYGFLTSSKDTFQLVPSSPFNGSTKYKLFVSGESFNFYTYAYEQEPNNTIGSADLLNGKMFGSVAYVNDTDFYVVKTNNAKCFYLRSYNSESVFSVIDSTGRVTSPRAYRAVDSLVVPDSFAYPLFLRVVANYRSSGGYYELGSF